MAYRSILDGHIVVYQTPGLRSRGTGMEGSCRGRGVWGGKIAFTAALASVSARAAVRHSPVGLSAGTLERDGTQGLEGSAGYRAGKIDWAQSQESFVQFLQR